MQKEDLCIKQQSWPGQMLRSVYGDHERFMNTYLRHNYEGYYFTGDGCKRETKDGFYRITGRVDDVIKCFWA